MSINNYYLKVDIAKYDENNDNNDLRKQKICQMMVCIQQQCNIIM